MLARPPFPHPIPAQPPFALGHLGFRTLGRPSRGHKLILIIRLFSSRQRREDSLIAVKVNPDFERGGEAAGGGVGRARRGGGPE